VNHGKIRCTKDHAVDRNPHQDLSSSDYSFFMLFLEGAGVISFSCDMANKTHAP
jgi:hypothetical protein